MRLRHVDCTHQCSTGEFTRRNYFSRAKQFVASCILGAMLPFTMLGVTNCGSNQEQQSVVTTSAKTDSSGVASFEVNGSQFRLNFYDFETQTPISDLSVVLYAKEGNGVYQTYDPNNVYMPMLEGVKAINYQATGSLQSALTEDSHLFGEGTNVFVKTKTECSSYGFNDGLQGKLPEEIFNDKVWRDEHLKPLTDVAVPLSDLDNYLGDVINNLIGEQVQSVGEDAITKDLVPVIIKLVGLGKSAGKIVAEGVKGTFGFAGLLALTADACSIVERQSWARYYRSLCYAEDTEFKIYKVTDAWEAYVNLGEITIGFETPQLVVLPELPDEMEPTWTPAAAKVSGSIYYRDSAVDLAWKTPETLAKVKFESQDAPYGEVSIYSPMQGNGSYTFIVGACNDPTYKITGEMPVPPLMLQGTTTLKVQNGQEYKLDFYFDKACAFNGNTYETYSKEDANGVISLAVACTPLAGYIAGSGTTVTPVACKKAASYTTHCCARPDVSDEYFVFEDGSLFYGRVLDLSITEVPGDSNCAPTSHARVWKNIIAFNCSGTGCSGVCKHTIGESTIEFVGSGYDPDIDEGKIVYTTNSQSWGDASLIFHIYDIQTATNRDYNIPYEYPGIGTAPTIVGLHDSRLIYTFILSDGAYRLGYYNIDTDELLTIAGFGSMPSIYGTNVLYAKDGNLVVYDLMSSLTHQAFQEPPSSGWPFSAQIAKDGIVYSAHNSGGDELYLLNLGSNQITQLTNGQTPKSKVTPVVYDSTIVFNGTGESVFDIGVYVCTPEKDD